MCLQSVYYQYLAPVQRGVGSLEHLRESMLKDRFEKGFKLALLKDLKIIRELAQDLDISMSTVESAIREYQQLVESGDGDNDISGLIKLKPKSALNSD